MPVAWSATLLLFVLIPLHRNASAAPSLQLLNPWLSACDLADPQNAPDLKGVCLATMKPTNINNNVTNSRNCRVNGDISEGPGPPPCETNPNSTSTSTTTTSTITTTTTTTTTTTPHQNTNQCLDYLNESHKTTVCRGGVRGREALARLRLRHCCEHSVLSALSAQVREKVVADRDVCETYLNSLLELDALARSIACKFSEVLRRYDCDQPYSVSFNCKHCKEAYRQWVCGTLFPHFLLDTEKRARPCRSMCQKVEQQCPFFLPGDRYPAYPTQYAGEPTFLCIDPNIPETGEQLSKSSYGDGGCCYHHCGKEDGDICYTEQCFTTNTTTSTAVTVNHCEATAARTVVFSACSPSGTNIMVHPPLGTTSRGAATPATKTLFITLLLHIIFLLVSEMFGLGFT